MHKLREAPWNTVEGEGFEQDFVGVFAVGFDVVRTLDRISIGIHIGFWTFDIPLWRAAAIETQKGGERMYRIVEENGKFLIEKIVEPTYFLDEDTEEPKEFDSREAAEAVMAKLA